MGSHCNRDAWTLFWISIILEVFFRKRIFLSFEVCLQTSSRVVEQPLARGKTSYGVIWILKSTPQSRLYNPCIVPIIVLVKRHDQGLCSPSSEKQEPSSLYVYASLCVNWWVFECLSVSMFELVNPFQSLHHKEHSSPLIMHQLGIRAQPRIGQRLHILEFWGKRLHSFWVFRRRKALGDFDAL